VNLLYEILSEAIILPLFFFVGQVKEDKPRFASRVRTGILISLGVYAVLSAVVFIFAEPLLTLMATDPTIIDASAAYIRIESIAHVFSILTQFALVALVTVDKSRYLYALTGARLVLCLLSDTFLVSTLPVSANLGVNPSLTITAQAERAMAFWPNKGEADRRPALGAPYARIEPVRPVAPAVPDHAPGALRLPIVGVS
jgi:hypothetical protein